MSLVSLSLSSWYAVYDISEVPGGPAGPGTPGVPSLPSLPALPGSPGSSWQTSPAAGSRRRLTATVTVEGVIAVQLLLAAAKCTWLQK